MPALDFEKAKTQLQEFLSRLLKTARIDLRFEIRPGAARSPAGNANEEERTPELTVDFSGPDTDILLAKGGELLEALEDLSGRFLRLPSEERGRISFDSRDFKMLRVEELKLVAETAAEKVVKSGAPFALSPMNSRDRRVVHLALKDNPAVRTESEGGGPYRKVVIFPAAMKPAERK
jgi:spoIIIJ-associated protein